MSGSRRPSSPTTRTSPRHSASLSRATKTCGTSLTRAAPPASPAHRLSPSRRPRPSQCRGGQTRFQFFQTLTTAGGMLLLARADQSIYRMRTTARDEKDA